MAQVRYTLYVEDVLIDEDLSYEEILYWENHIMPHLDDHEVFLIMAFDEEGKYVSHSESWLMEGTLYRIVRYPMDPYVYMQTIPLKEESK